MTGPFHFGWRCRLGQVDNLLHANQYGRSKAPGGCSTACDEGDDDVGGVAVEVLAPTIVNGRGPRIGVAGRDLHVP